MNSQMTVLESLFVGGFGIAVDFVVLIGLSLLLWLQSALINRFSRKRKAIPLAVEADGADSAPELSEPEPELSEPEPEPELSEPPAAYAEPDDGSEVVTSPVPGTVLELKVDVGTAVKRGDSLMMLEAMKMEYEINASSDGTVTQIFTSVGAAVEAGKPQIVIL